MAAITRPIGSTSSRRKGFALIALAALALAGIAGALVFAWPRTNLPPKLMDLGSVDKYPIGSVTMVPKGKFYLVRLSESEFIALSWREPDRGCTVPWRPTFRWPDPETGFVSTGWFRSACTGSTFDGEGHKVWGRAPRDMDRYAVSILSGRVFVDTSQYVCGWAPPGAGCVGATPAP